MKRKYLIGIFAILVFLVVNSCIEDDGLYYQEHKRNGETFEKPGEVIPVYDSTIINNGAKNEVDPPKDVKK